MKHSQPFCSVLLFFAVIFTSCSNVPNDEKLKAILSEREKAHLTDLKTIILVAPCSGVGAVLEIPKKFTRLSELEKVGNEDIMEADNARAKQLLDNLALGGLIIMTKTTDKTYMNILNKMVSVQEYEIQLSDEGNKLLVGQTGDNFILALVDVNNIEITKTTKISEDTLKVNYIRGFTSAYETLKKVCVGERLLIDSSAAMLVKNRDIWKPLY